MEKFDLENFPTSESALKMLSYVTGGFYDNSYVGKWLFQVMGIEFDAAQKIVDELPDQFFPETATWGLAYHEIKWGLPIRENLPYEERRRLIYQKRDYRAPMTPHRMERYLEDATGFEVHIADANDPGEYGYNAPHPNVFKAYFIGEGTLDSKKVHETLDRLKQSHTTYKVNDRIEIVADESNEEKIILRNIRFKMGIPFWYEYIYDGSWLLDGSVILNQKRRYGLRLGLKYNLGYFLSSEAIRFISVKYALKIKNSEVINARVSHSFGINFWNVLCYDGSWMLDGSVLLNEMRRYGLALGIRNLIQTENTEDIRLHSLSTGWRQHLKEKVEASAVFNFSADFWRVLYLNGYGLLDGESYLNQNRCRAKVGLILHSGVDLSEQEKIADVTIETKTRDYWFLDGALSLDGTRNLNSIYRKSS